MVYDLLIGNLNFFVFSEIDFNYLSERYNEESILLRIKYQSIIKYSLTFHYIILQILKH